MSASVLLRIASVPYRYVRKLGLSAWIWKVPGALRLATTLYDALRPEGTMLVTSRGHRLHVDPSDPAIGKRYVLGDEHEPQEKDFFETFVQQGMIVVDVGANIGDYVLLAARACGATGKVWAFEPDPKSYGLLMRNVAENGYENVSCMQAACGASTGRLTLYLDAANHGNNSFSRDNVIAGGGSIEVEVVVLDSFCEQHGFVPDIVKMDVQGAEAAVLAGASALLRNPSVKFIMEFWPVGIQKCGGDPWSMLAAVIATGRTISLLKGGRVVPVQESWLRTLTGDYDYCDLIF